jgi:flagellar basal-body rod protein FlgB
MSYLGIKVFDYSKQQLQYLQRRQGVLATNIANSDTPGYVARDVVPPAFKHIVQPGQRQPLPLRSPDSDGTLQKGLLHGGVKVRQLAHDESRLSGNNVIIEDQLKMVNETNLLQQQVLAVYKEYASQISDLFQH